MTKEMEWVKLLGLHKLQARSVFVGHRYLQHRRYDSRGSEDLKQHNYLIPAVCNGNNAVSFAYDKSLEVEKSDLALLENKEGVRMPAK